MATQKVKDASKKQEEAQTAHRPRRTRTGIVVSDKMNKTCVVRVERMVQDKGYGKFVRRWGKVKVHDENNTAKEGDLVAIVESRPLSRDKRWALQSVVRASSGRVLSTADE